MYKHLSTALDQTRLDGGTVVVYKRQFPGLSFKHVWIVVLYLSTSISLQPCVFPVCSRIRQQPFASNTFDYGCLFVYPPTNTKMKVTPEQEKIFSSGQSSESAVNLLGERATLWSG